MSSTAGVVFDLDETLIDRNASLSAFAANLWFAEQTNIQLSQDQFVRNFIQLDGYGYADKQHLFTETARLVAGLSVHRLTQHYLDTIHNNPVLFDGVVDTLSQIRQLQVPIGIVTNGATGPQRKKISATGIEDLVDAVVISEEFGHKKPSANIFAEITLRLNITPADSWFIGDHPVLDIWGSHQAGFSTIWVERHLPWPSDLEYCATHRVDSISAAKRIVCHEPRQI